MAKILRLKEVNEVTGVCRATMYLMRKAGKFPQPIHISPRSVGWLEEDINQWIAERKAAGYTPKPPMCSLKAAA